MSVRTLIVLAAVLGADRPAFGQLGPLIYSQLPNRNFAYASDTAILNDFGQLDSEINADRFSLFSAAEIKQFVWWGVYGPQLGPVQPPPTNESYRIRIYDQNGTFPPNLPPANILYEVTVANPLREETAFLVSGGFPEYRFVANLAQSIQLQGSTPYWLEISQLGDPQSYFRWETSPGAGALAYQHPEGTAWNVGPGDVAYQLHIPEPLTGGMLALAVFSEALRRRRGRR